MEDNEDLKLFYINEIKQTLSEENANEIEQKEETTKSLHSNKLNSVKLPRKKEVEVIVFKKGKPNASNTSLNQKVDFSNDTGPTCSDKNLLKAKKLLKQIEWDVASYGMKGFSSGDKRMMEKERAISLGARQKKRKYVNYKVLMEERKKNPPPEEKGKTSKTRRKRVKTVFWQDKISVGKFGQVGKFDGGVLKLSRKDVKSIKK